MIISNDKHTRKNEDIRVPQLRVIDAEGNNVGIMSREDALKLAAASTLDLVEIVPNAEPPVARVMDFGKYRFEQQKKATAARKKTKQQEIKELKFRPTTEDGDFQVKMRKAREFIEEGDKVKITIRFKGREMAHTELGGLMARKIEAELINEVIVEQFPRLEGRQLSMMLAPKKK